MIEGFTFGYRLTHRFSTDPPAPPMRVLTATALATSALLLVPALSFASGANSGGSQYLPSVPGGSGPEPAKGLAPAAAADPAVQAGSITTGPTGAGDTRIGSLFPSLLGLALLTALAISVRRLPGDRGRTRNRINRDSLLL